MPRVPSDPQAHRALAEPPAHRVHGESLVLAGQLVLAASLVYEAWMELSAQQVPAAPPALLVQGVLGAPLAPGATPVSLASKAPRVLEEALVLKVWSVPPACKALEARLALLA